MKKALLFFVMFTSIIFEVRAQFSLNIVISYPAPMYLSDWNSSRTGLATVILNVPEQITRQIKFNTRILNSEGEIIANSHDALAEIFLVQRGANNFSLEKILQLHNLEFKNHTIATIVQRSGKLPSGTYQLCVSILDAVENIELTKAPVYVSFVQASYRLPVLLWPSDKAQLDVLTSQTVITFRWSGLTPRALEQVIYRLQVFEIKESQNPLQALLSNQPILNVEVLNTTQYFWRPQLYLNDTENHQFIWAIQTLDAEGLPIITGDAENQGRSEPFVFDIDKKQPGHQNDKENPSNE